MAEWVGRHQRAAGRGRKVTRGTLDIDPFPIEVHGKQPAGAYHGYYRETIYHPLVTSFCAAGSYASSRLGEFNGVIGAGLSAGSFAASLLLKLLAFNLAGMLRGQLEDASGCGGI